MHRIVDWFDLGADPEIEVAVSERCYATTHRIVDRFDLGADPEIENENENENEYDR